jgi:uncharacterized peroxidase-related enzyme
MTTRLTPVDPANASGPVKGLFDAIQKKLGVTPNMMRTMAQSPAVLEAYLAFNSALGGPGAALSAKTREELALAIAATNSCDYCASAHTALGKMAGLTADQAGAALRGVGTDATATAALRLARSIIDTKGDVSDQDLAAARTAGLREPEIAEVVAHVALNIFTNYFNRLARTNIDFPKVSVGKRP